MTELSRSRLIRLAIECGIGDQDLSDAESVVTDYGDSTGAVLQFADVVATGERERLRGYFREALADKGITWPAEVDILYDKCFGRST